jgi:long-chain fatty acid transport protein
MIILNNIKMQVFYKRKYSVTPQGILLIGGLALTDVAHASNGLNLIGFGAESMGMAGTDLALARDSSALNTNPAGLGQISGTLLDLNMALGYGGGIRHEDRLGNDVANANDLAVLSSLGYAHRLMDTPITVGIGLFAQGGTGTTFEELTTPFGTTDEMSVLFRVARITPGAAWRVNDTLSLGASLILTYSDLEQKVFPDTSFLGPTPTSSFFGQKIEGLDALDSGLKLGVMYKPSERLILGASYTSQVDIELDGGTLQADMSALGLGKVTYDKVKMSGLNQPQELGLGVAYQYDHNLLLAAELNWIDWSEALKRARLYIADPNNPAAPASLEQYTTHNWRDQYVLSLGALYDVNPDLALRLGYNYGRNPIPSNHQNPLLNTISEHHVTLGFGWKVNAHWRVDGAFEWDMENSLTYTNNELPFGPDSKVEGELLALHFSMSRIW